MCIIHPQIYKSCISWIVQYCSHKTYTKHIHAHTHIHTHNTHTHIHTHTCTHTHAHTHNNTHTHTHTHTHTQRTKDVRCSLMGYVPPDPGILNWGALGLALNKLLKLGQALTVALTMPLCCGVGTHSLTCTSVELGTASALSFPSLSQVPNLLCIFLGPGLGTKWRKIFFLHW